MCGSSAMLRSLPPLLALALAVACDPELPPPPIDRNDTPTPAGSTGDDPSSTGEPLPDPDDGDDDDARCGAVDLLFVIDDSGSMADEQANLVASFPGFIADIEELLGETRYHIGVVTTDEYEFNGHGCRRLGALTTRTGGEASSDAACGPFRDERHYMTAGHDLADDFACAARVGIEGSGVERPMDAVDRTLADEGGVGMCNEGFLRDEALLVLVLITDEDDDHSEGDPRAWHDAIVAAKGDPERVVLLSLVGTPKPNACIPEQWDGKTGAEIAHRLIELTSSFPHGHVGDVCAPSYKQFFAEAIAPIADACGIPLAPE